jgi:cell division protein FtsX
VNKDKTKFGRMKQVFEGIFTGLGVFGILVVVLAMLLFSFYLQLVIARSRDSIRLLLTLGYSPNWLSRHFTQRFIPVYVFIIVAALALTAFMQFAFHRWVMYSRPELQSWPHWSVLLTALVLLALSAWTNYKLVRKKMGEGEF